ncbi:MAG: SurA N-terminal domain-containing protein [Bacteroidales bacterium]|jgi:peptidyl-prolyl cis-trans isomerase D|nr:SurA N-terminal domain-containing protein [Bacteroidales bacterium]
MAAIGSIRKHGVLLMIIIGFALVLFLLTGLFDGNALNRFLYADQYSKGKVNGEYIDEKYNTLYDELTMLYKILNNKSTLEESEIYFIHELTWEQIIAEATVGSELESLGIIYTDAMTETIMDEVYASLPTNQPNNYLMGLFQYLSERFGVEQAQQILMSIREAKDEPSYAQIYAMYKVIENRIVFESKLQTYQGFAAGSVNFSDELAKKTAADNKTMTAKLLTINPQHTAFAEIDATVSDKELKKFYEDNKIRYKNREETRDIDLALFPIMPTTTDKLNIEDKVRGQFERFQASTIDSFNRNEMFSQLDSVFHKRGDNLAVNTKNGYVSIENIDTLEKIIFNMSMKGYIEPFNYEDKTWFYGQTLDAAYRPDSVMVAFLIVDYRSSQNQSGTRTKKQARLEADSLKQVLESQTTSIFTLRPSYMAGNNISDSTMWVDESRTIRTLYNSFLETPVGGLYVHSAQSAFIVYQVLEKTAPVEKRRYALYAEDIQASEETVNALRTQAQKLAASSTTTAEFITEANNAGVQVLNGKSIGSMKADINQFSNCRAVVAWAFSENIGKNDVSDVFKLDNGHFVVASVVNVTPQGIPAFEDVKDQIAIELGNQKKIELVREKIASELSGGKSLQDVGTAYGAGVMEGAALTYLGDQGQNRGVDNGAIGEMFGKSANTETQTMAGKNSVFALAVENMADAAPATEDLQQEKFMLRNICLGRGSRNEYSIILSLKKHIEIKDNRARFYR